MMSQSSYLRNIVLFGLVVAVGVLYLDNSELSNEKKTLSSRLAQVEWQTQNQLKQLNAKIEVLSAFKKASELKLAAQSSELSSQKADASDILKRLEAAENTLGSLEPTVRDLAKTAITEQLISESVNKASLSTRDVLIRSDDFVKRLASGLAENHADQLRGKPGADADNEEVARWLSSNANFVDQVSLSVLVK